MDPDFTIVLYGASESEREHCAERARRLTVRPLEVSSAPAGTADPPGRVRNQAVRAARGRFVVFFRGTEPPDSSFLEAALRSLDRNPSWSFIAAWHDGVPQVRDRPSKPLAFADLLARPWFAFVPTVFRRGLWQELGGFDETLRALEDFDFWVRALSAGKIGAAIEEPAHDARPWGNSLDYSDPDAQNEAKRVFERHAARFSEHWEETLLGKERIVRELIAQRIGLEKRALELQSEERRLTDLLARAGSEKKC